MTWAEVKQVCLARPGGFLGDVCELCGLRPPVDAHHRMLRSRGGLDVVSNLAALCRECHDRCHARPLRAAQLGYLLDTGQDSLAVPIRLWNGTEMLLADDGTYAFHHAA